jgi:uroporphyrinogen-III decarboxylase
LGVSFKMIPTFEEKVLEHRDGHYIVQDWMGAITEISDRYDYTYIRSAKDFVTRKWHRFPVQNRADWENMKWRFDPEHAERFPPDFEKRTLILRDRERVLQLSINGPFWQLREWCGFEGLCLLMTEQPDLVQEMVDFWEAFVLQTLQPLLEQVVPDYVVFNEDMAYKLHSMISPRMARHFLLPTWQHWVQVLRKAGCPVICIDSDGYMAELLPLWIEAGFNCCYPVEVAAGNDIIAFRQQYGRQIAFVGGIDKRALATGGEVIRAELLRVVPPLLEFGGFIPSCDHGVPPDISWPNFIEYSHLLAQLTGWSG